MPRRLTRQEQRERTRKRLLKSAASVFARRGLHAASVEDVAEDAGFSKGAVYANFDSKDDLFLALLEEHYDRWLASLREADSSSDTVQDGALRSGNEYMSYLSEDPNWPKLFLEFWLHALRREEIQATLIARNNDMRSAIADIYEQRLAGSVRLPFSFEELSRMSYAMGNGVAMDMALEPDAVPEDFFAKILSIFITGLLTMAEPLDSAESETAGSGASA